MMLHDVSPERLGVAHRFADRVNERNGSPITIEASLDPSEALSGADFCLTSAEVGRWPHWIEDYEIPVRHGATQITGENGGPGAVFHSLRSIRTMLGICGDIERYCPDAFLINLTNPLSRVALAVNTGTAIKNISMCHEFAGGVGRIARLLRIPKAKIAAKASGINHFTFFTEIKRSDTGEDLYPRLRRLWQKRFFDFPPPVTATAQQLVKVPWVQMVVEQMYSPLVAHMFREYGLLPCSVDSHIGEYVPFAKEVAGWHPVPVYFHEGVMARVERMVTRYGNGESHIPMHKAGRSAEEVFPVIGAIWSGESQNHQCGQCPQSRIRAQSARGSHRRGPGGRRRRRGRRIRHAAHHRAAGRVHADPDRVAGAGGQGGDQGGSGARLRRPASATRSRRPMRPHAAGSSMS